MEEVPSRFTPEAANAVRAALAEAKDVVFLLGARQGKRIAEVRLLSSARGQGDADIAAAVRRGEVVIRNETNHAQVPDTAARALAGTLAKQGVGLYLVNEALTRVSVLGEPQAPALPSLSPGRGAELLGPKGPIAAALPAYEHRPEQMRMAVAVGAAFNEDGILSVEAGTGTGKSLAYLVPAILRARAADERVIVSTHTINLQEQLVQKDLPLLVERAGIECRYALVKGRSNYLCRRKAAQVEAQGASLIEDELAREVRGLLDWARHTLDGSRADLPSRPSEAAWEQLASESDNCLRTRCPHYDKCFFYAARRAANTADVLVVNHHLLMADLALRQEIGSYTRNAVLPPGTRFIVDEAHHLEDAATAHFSQQVSPAALDRTLARLQSRRREKKGILPSFIAALRSLRGGEDAAIAAGAVHWIEESLLPRRAGLCADGEEVFGRILTDFARLYPAREDLREKLRITEAVRATPLWSLIRDEFTRLARSVQTFAADFAGVLERTTALSAGESQQILYLGTELRAQRDRLRRFAEVLDSFVAEEDGRCRWIECRPVRGSIHLSFHIAPVAVAPLLREVLFERAGTTILTSATLTVGGRFDFLHERLGINDVDPPERVDSLRVASPFDFRRQALVLVPRDLSAPGTPAYEEETHAVMREALSITGGGTFLLFTSYGALRRAYAALSKTLATAGITALLQGELPRHALLDRFRGDPAAVLFGTDSFWEGVDVKGHALRCVVIARLPFRVPSEPLEQARVQAIEERGGNAFVEHTVPQAVVKLQQGFGRLIRSRDDRGCVLILDSRTATRRYGATFLSSLPPAPQILDSRGRVMEAMRRFFSTTK